MSTLQVDRISPSSRPLVEIDGVGDLQTFIANPEQIQFTLTKFDNMSQMRVFVGEVEATWNWVAGSSTSFRITTPSINAGDRVRAYKVFGDLAFKSDLYLSQFVTLDDLDPYALKTGNVSSATKLAVARTINGTPFDGTQNITVSDSSKVPLSGGTMTGNLAVPTINLSGTMTIATNLTFAGNASNGAVITNGNGSVSIGNRSTSYTHYQSSTGAHYFYGTVLAEGNSGAFSDKRLKKNIKTIEHALDKVERLNGVIFDRTDINARQVGLIAQDVQEVLPEAVIDTGKYLGVAYGNLVGLLVEAIKELRAEVKELKADIEVSKK